MKRATSIFYLIQGFGFTLLFDPVGRLYIKLDPYYIGRIHGLCGNNDGDSQDFISAAGMVEPKEDFFESFKSPACTNSASSGDMDPCGIYSSVSLFLFISFHDL